MQSVHALLLTTHIETSCGASAKGSVNKRRIQIEKNDGSGPGKGGLKE